MLMLIAVQPKNPKLQNILYYVGSFLIPNIFLFFLYAQNFKMSFIRLDHTLIIGAMMGLFGVLIFLALRFTSKHFGVAFVFSILLWIFIWNFVNVARFFEISSTFSGVVLLVVGFAMAFGLCALMRFAKPKPRAKLMRLLEKMDIVFSFILWVVGLLFVFNFVNKYVKKVSRIHF